MTRWQDSPDGRKIHTLDWPYESLLAIDCLRINYRLGLRPTDVH